MKKVTQKGKLEFAYQTISKMESVINKQRQQNDLLFKALDEFVNSCYTGCNKDQLNKLRQDAEYALSQSKNV